MRGKTYPKEFKDKVIELHRSGRSARSLAAEFGPHETTIGGWIAQADRDAGKRSDGLTSDERAELVKLRRENKRLKVEREILAKATAWFARETDSSR